ncbi:MAG: hypothetical protein DRO11_09630 [Methanobacteriota archaeon]|nr:MAG: hypothetical protein DRO11_09630 [Euryarchaeota archaeon]
MLRDEWIKMCYSLCHSSEISIKERLKERELDKYDIDIIENHCNKRNLRQFFEDCVSLRLPCYDVALSLSLRAHNSGYAVRIALRVSFPALGTCPTEKAIKKCEG